MPLYFAFGSNMSSARLIARVGEVEVVGRAQLPGHAHAFDKLGADQTGKGNVFPRADATSGPRAMGAPPSCVWGVVYRLDARQLESLDAFEGGYRRTRVEVITDHAPRLALTYVAHRRHGGLRPSDDYLAHYLRGMREHEIPDDYVGFIRRLAARPS